MQLAVLIPAYKPSAALVALVRDLAGRGMNAIILVDDGSGPEFRAIFDQAAQFPGVHVLRHAVNLGKGAALKTGINHALCTFPDLIGIVTADASSTIPRTSNASRPACAKRPIRWCSGARSGRRPDCAAFPPASPRASCA